MEFIQSIGLSKFIAIDLETSGLNPKEDKIIEISACKFDNGKLTSSWTRLINPNIKLSHTVTQITGITDEMLQDKPSIESIIKDFILFIGDLPIVGHNIMFDLSFLQNNMIEYNMLFNDRMICDTFYLSKMYYYNFNSFSLSSLCQNLNIQIKESHRAEEDAKNSGLLFIKILKYEILKTNLKTAQKIVNCIKHYNVPNKKLFNNLISYLLEFGNTIETNDLDIDNKQLSFSSDYYFDEKYDENITIDDIFTDEGILKKNFDSFEIRDNQIGFCKDIHNNFLNNSILIAEAGAGLGKSYAYLLAALLYSQNNHTQIIISTNTHNLQNQLFDKDIPFIINALKYNCKATIIKGMNNYICLSRLEEVLRNITNKLNHLEALEIASLFIWLNNTSTGDISECNGFNKNRYNYLWFLINTKSDYCLTHRCNKYNGCFYKKIRDLAALSDILIVNHSMLISYYDNHDSFITDNSICIIDECHNFHSICKKQLSSQITSQLFNEQKYDYESIIVSLKNKKLDRELIDVGREISHDFDEVYKLFSNLCYEIFQSFVLSPIQSEYMQNIFINKNNLFLNDKQLSKDFLYKYYSIIKRINSYISLLEKYELEYKIKYDLINIRMFIKNIENYYLIIDSIINNKDDGINWFSYLYLKGKLQKSSLNSAPNNLNEVTHNIFNKFSSTVFCSATLSTDSGFDFFIRQMGMQDLAYQDGIQLKKYASPYFYQDQSKLFIINTETDLSDKEHFEKVANDIVEISISTNKRILVLCTSFKQIYSFQSIMNSYSSIKGRCIYQIKGVSKSILLNEYLDSNKSILFGTNTFWEGIDLPNDKLEILIIFKLPFSNPSNPYVQSNIEYYQSRNLDAFYSYQLQDTILKLRQGFGRLIRSYDDMGICIITDPRITKRKYGLHIIDSLPIEPIYYSSPFKIIDAAGQFLK